MPSNKSLDGNPFFVFVLEGRNTQQWFVNNAQLQDLDQQRGTHLSKEDSLTSLLKRDKKDEHYQAQLVLDIPGNNVVHLVGITHEFPEVDEEEVVHVENATEQYSNKKPVFRLAAASIETTEQVSQIVQAKFEAFSDEESKPFWSRLLSIASLKAVEKYVVEKNAKGIDIVKSFGRRLGPHVYGYRSAAVLLEVNTWDILNWANEGRIGWLNPNEKRYLFSKSELEAIRTEKFVLEAQTRYRGEVADKSKELHQERIDLARERLTLLREEFCDVDLARECLHVFQEEFITKQEAAELLGVSDNRTKQLASSGRIGTEFFGRYIFTRFEVEDFEKQDRPTGIHRKTP